MQTTTIDNVAMALSGTLLTLGVVVLGIVEIVDGEPYGAAPVTNEAGEVVATPGVDPAIRTGLVLAGLIVLLLWGGYRAVAGPDTSGSTTGTTAATRTQ
ncbi:hypothetical protein EI982_01320 [Haloplanus rallus]|jgi:hypothetical protein|uniref:Uncharacterized protein n=1 Tax=Haloplanus rallus TaxID=1816183 RepID=A0A6B9F558_9EURY|nr:MULTISPECIES: hypothetical protein [Haloplanus]QGX93527.1 hypothetical protein EI982_01320 [Haloplanus rallus]